MSAKKNNEFDNFIDVFVDELIQTPDDEVLEGFEPSAVQAKGLSLLQAAITKVSRLRLAAAKAGYAALKSSPVMTPTDVSPEEARHFLAQASNDSRYTLAARNLGELSDAEALSLYAKIKSIESHEGGDGK